MAKFMYVVQYSRDGLAGSVNEGFRTREAYIRQFVESAGAKVEALYWAYGEDDLVLIVDADPAVAVGASLAVNLSEVGRIRTTPLLTAEDMDAAIARMPQYRAPGR